MTAAWRSVDVRVDRTAFCLALVVFLSSFSFVDFFEGVTPLADGLRSATVAPAAESLSAAISSAISSDRFASASTGSFPGPR